jgi:hypothetical protein
MPTMPTMDDNPLFGLDLSNDDASSVANSCFSSSVDGDAPAPKSRLLRPLSSRP